MKKSTTREIIHNLRNLHYPSRRESRAVSTLLGEFQFKPGSCHDQVAVTNGRAGPYATPVVPHW
jgi:hypothetical protein